MALSRKINKGVILAAGDGNRLGSLTLTRPKVLLPVEDKWPLIRYPIEALAAAGINEIAIVVGYLGDQVIDMLGTGKNFGIKLHYFSNLDYLGGNAISVYKARDWAQGEPVVLCMGDHIIEERLVKRLLDGQGSNETLCIDYAPAYHHQLAEATKVIVNSTGCITDIGKDLVYWDALDTGVFLLTENFFQALEKLIHRHGKDVEITDVVRFLINEGYRFDSCNCSGCFWMDVDTKEDLIMART